MLLRVVSAIIGIGLIVPSPFLYNGLPFLVLMGVVTLICYTEFCYALRRAKWAQPSYTIGYVNCLLLIVMAWRDHNFAIAVSIAGIIYGLSTILVERSSKNCCLAMAGAFYVSLPLSFLWATYKLNGQGSMLVLSLFLAIWATDTFAYFTGKLLGKHKLCPKISPGKTVEGALGGLISGTAIGCIMFLHLDFTLHDSLAIGLIAAAFSQLGDLAASAIKRQLGIKDFGNIIPGHGGLLDRLDSTIVAAPITYLYLRLIVF